MQKKLSLVVTSIPCGINVALDEEKKSCFSLEIHHHPNLQSPKSQINARFYLWKMCIWGKGSRTSVPMNAMHLVSACVTGVNGEGQGRRETRRTAVVWSCHARPRCRWSFSKYLKYDVWSMSCIQSHNKIIDSVRLLTELSRRTHLRFVAV